MGNNSDIPTPASPNPRHGGTSSASTSESYEKKQKALESQSMQFGILVLISTFTAALIIAFLSLVYSVVDEKGQDTIKFEVGVLVAFISTGTHIVVTIVAGRTAAVSLAKAKQVLSEAQSIPPPTRPANRHFSSSAATLNGNQCNKAVDIPEEVGIPEKDVDLEKAGESEKAEDPDFHRFMILCERLQLLGTLLFVLAMLLLIFLIFNRWEFPVVLYVITVASVFAVFNTGFWKVSVLWETLTQFKAFCRRLPGNMQGNPTQAQN